MNARQRERVPGTAMARAHSRSAPRTQESEMTHDSYGRPVQGLHDRPVDRRTATGGDVVRVLAAILLPPLGVFLQVGIGLHFWLNILLTIFGYLPGIIHAIWIILRR